MVNGKKWLIRVIPFDRTSDVIGEMYIGSTQVCIRLSTHAYKKFCDKQNEIYYPQYFLQGGTIVEYLKDRSHSNTYCQCRPDWLFSINIAQKTRA